MHDINTLVKLLRGQVRRHDCYTELVLRQLPHILIGAEVVWGKCRHPIEHSTEVLLNLVTHVDLLLEEEKVIHASVFSQVTDVIFNRVDLVQVRDHNLMDLFAQFFLSDTADRLSDVLGERYINFLLVIIYSSLRILQVPDVI